MDNSYDFRQVLVAIGTLHVAYRNDINASVDPTTWTLTKPYEEVKQMWIERMIQLRDLTLIVSSNVSLTTNFDPRYQYTPLFTLSKFTLTPNSDTLSTDGKADNYMLVNRLTMLWTEAMSHRCMLDITIWPHELSLFAINGQYPKNLARMLIESNKYPDMVNLEPLLFGDKFNV